MSYFIHEDTARTVIFGIGRRDRTRATVERLGGRPLLITGRTAARVAPELIAELRASAAATIDEVRRHVPVEDADAARALATASRATSIVALGGGSAIGLAKAVALTSSLPIVAVPTTYSGSEQTPVWGLTENSVKTTGRAPRVAPRVVIYDPELTYSIPASTTATSGLNALAHCIDVLWAPARTPLTDAMSERAVAELQASLPDATADGTDAEARERMLIGAWLAGAAFGVAGSSLHHKICHTLGGRFDLPHAETHAVVLPWSTRLAASHLPQAARTISRLLGGSDAFAAVSELADRVGAPRTLQELGLTRDQALAVADEIKLDSLAVPFEVSRTELRELLLGATCGGV